MNKDKLTKIVLEASDLKLIRHPKREIKVQASKIRESDTYATVFPKEGPKDILYVSLVSYTIGHINKNDCLILPEEGMATYKSSIEKPLNVEHERTDIVGFCVNAYLSNIKNNKIISEEAAQEILDNKGMVNIGNIFAVWKLNHPDLVELIEENFDQNSQNFDSVKASFEYYFENFKIFKSNGNADYPDGELIDSDAPEASELIDSLKIKGGTGFYKGSRISICPLDGFLGGVALTLNPANEFSDLTGKQDEGKLIVQLNSDNNKIIEKSVINTTGDSIMENKVEVKKEEIKVEAAIPLSVDKTVADEMQKQLDIKIGELNAEKDVTKNLQASVEELKQQMTAFQDDAKKSSEMALQIQKQLDAEIEARKVSEATENARVQKELVASRLSKLAEVIKIDDTNRAVLEKECAGISDEDFLAKLSFYKSISNKVEASTEVKSEAAPNIKEVVKEVVADTVKDTKSVNIFAAAPSDSLIQKFASAFNPEGLGFAK